VQRRRLGRLGHDSSVLLYGGAALGEVSQEVADASVREALEAGIDHFDVAADYGGPSSGSVRSWTSCGPQVFLATKTGLRDRDAAGRRSTPRSSGCGPTASTCCSFTPSATSPSSTAPPARRRARGGGPGAGGGAGRRGRHHRARPPATATHLEALRRFPFATVLTPLNAVLWRDERSATTGRPSSTRSAGQDAGLMTIKTVSRATGRRGGGAAVGDRDYATWYEPLVDPEQIRAASRGSSPTRRSPAWPPPATCGLLRHLVAAERDRMDASMRKPR
jgi:hypothetical protein